MARRIVREFGSPAIPPGHVSESAALGTPSRAAHFERDGVSPSGGGSPGPCTPPAPG